jgi:hypothetical protein
MGLLQVLFDQHIWHVIGAKRSPTSIPGRLVLYDADLDREQGSEVYLDKHLVFVVFLVL